MHLLNAVTQSPDVTQRALAKRIGVALGLTNLMLRRLATKGYIKIVNVHKSRLQYLITPQGVMEKARLTREYIEYSLFFYRNVRTFLRERLTQLAEEGRKRVLLYGTGELAEISVLTMQEVGLTLAGVVETAPLPSQKFLGHPVRRIEHVPSELYDRVLIATLQRHAEIAIAVMALGLPAERIIVLPQPGAHEAPWPPVTETARESVPAEVAST